MLDYSDSSLSAYCIYKGENILFISSPFSFLYVHISPPAESRFLYCPPGWFKSGSRCFMYVSSPMTWINAEVLFQRTSNNESHLFSVC